MELKLTGFTQDELEKSTGNLMQVTDKIYDRLSNKTRIKTVFFTFAELKLFKLLSVLFTLNIQNEDTKFLSVLTERPEFTYIGHPKGIELIYTTGTERKASFINHMQTETPLPALAEVLSQENEAEILAYQHRDTKSIHVLSNKRFTLKQAVMVLRLYYQITYNRLSTPQEEYKLMLDAFITNDVENFNKYVNILINHPTLTKMENERYGKIFQNKLTNRLQAISDTIKTIREDIANLETQYLRKQNTLTEYLNTYDVIAGTENNINADEIGKYLLKHPYLTPVLNGDGNMTLHYIAPIVTFDPDAAERAKTHRMEPHQKILDIFANHYDEYELYTECFIKVYGDMTIRAIQHAVSYDRYIGQPHLDNYACYGNHIDNINQFAANGDVIGFIDQITEMVMNMNFYDGPVTDRLLESINSYKDICTWKHRETGVFMSTNEVLEVINGEA